MVSRLDEAIVKRFSMREEDFVEADDPLEASQWGATKLQKFEFQLAFNMIAEGESGLNDRQVSDLFLAIGYIVQDSELEIFFEACVRTEDQTFTIEVLLEAYDNWLKEQLEEKHIGAIFNMLAKEERILPHFPVEELDNNLKTYTKKNLKINKAGLKSVLGQVMFQDGSSNNVTDEDIIGLVDEIACSDKGLEDRTEPYILWNDFANLFRDGMRSADQN
mmetsp:Transcript_6601/g.6727  ORF Transcript_6601/g.6727 Transcript_6601/m.6727 type:complete len:219 (-) Transcript_6601:498-1154(-)|eukprot:CAMPEP_0119036846 /NCGR_PEP_ID=MMETSP1177-20130426/4850_1 /TAXON_ID=2985 /ORGANISM="Ochromonas sp, Strain CCMP1899" /LENGTH=218 /DNA_ID=CAMNT_0006997295 /DNA_START=199 /DNA_END=855 /DNA_ORIENTATION=-